MQSSIETNPNTTQVTPKYAALHQAVCDAPAADSDAMCSLGASVASTVLTDDFSDSNFSLCDDSISVSHNYCDVIDQEDDEPTFSVGDDTWTCFEDDTCRSTEAAYEDHVTGSLTPNLYEMNHEELRVRFKDTVEVREFAVTVGHQNPSDPILCPVTLDWQFFEIRRPLTVELDSIRTSEKLTEKQRRSWISFVQGWSYEQVRSLEIERVMEVMEEMMHRQVSFSDRLSEEKSDDCFFCDDLE
ncbi:hypothetical protein FisN_6Lh199 [Fistulifera solaris]|uniref:Uncharacterized protein n=1 Tax=Fistulifera solaris TaxID=1519565 RepID=A0A1Z5J5Z9_FISSO|nr:hypothetical protein FisN_6Lh199 [Fistulifera solaris]|eukprot:GAX09425.1 hypothetical protein FisN_6Lh199 [Fistulifera solaris]